MPIAKLRKEMPKTLQNIYKRNFQAVDLLKHRAKDGTPFDGVWHSVYMRSYQQPQKDRVATSGDQLQAGNVRLTAPDKEEWPYMPQKMFQRALLSDETGTIVPLETAASALVSEPPVEPLVSTTVDTETNVYGGDPYRFCRRKRRFPHLYRCPNRPVPAAMKSGPSEPVGYYSTVVDTWTVDKRRATKRKFLGHQQGDTCFWRY